VIKILENFPFVRYKTNDQIEMYSQRSHSHGEVSLGYIESGVTVIEVDGQKYELQPGDVVLIPADTVHLCNPVNPEKYKFHMFYFDLKWLWSRFPELAIKFRCLAVPGGKNISLLVNAFFKSSLNSLELENSVNSFLRKLIGQYDLTLFIPVPEEERMEGVHQLISKTPHNSLNIKKLAAQAGLNPYSFIRKYARLYGLTPHADIVNRRIQRAILLFETDMDLASISCECGFSDQSHFNKQFKLYSGVTPGEYRSAIKS
jgi:AraC-like DNA-binding protein